MEFKSTLFALSVLGLLSTTASATITGTSSVSATFNSTIEAGTCIAQVQNASGSLTSQINFGDVFKSDLINKTREEAFKIAFTGCAGVASATIRATTGAGGSCSSAASLNFGANNNTAFELWKDNSATGTQLSCKSPQTETVTISSGAATYNLSTRIVVADGKSIADVTTGSVTSPVTFLVTYQ
ncbi:MULTISPECIES: fimbrial protein [Enterobacter]|uniref:fimbrial protein n=1 Tax=Enterobacter TaxID=547 RepID=UPI001F43B5CB|nr:MULTISPECIES: fimbrial protein [Enterobacter]MCK7412950.1 fimbrial protein [Enterobacter bugandensis]